MSSNQCNCEAQGHGHDDKACPNERHPTYRMLYVGECCLDCFNKMPVKYLYVCDLFTHEKPCGQVLATARDINEREFRCCDEHKQYLAGWVKDSNNEIASEDAEARRYEEAAYGSRDD